MTEDTALTPQRDFDDREVKYEVAPAMPLTMEDRLSRLRVTIVESLNGLQEIIQEGKEDALTIDNLEHIKHTATMADSIVADLNQEATGELRHRVRELAESLKLIRPAPASRKLKRKSKTRGRPLPPKFRSLDRKQTWSGRGKQPRWIAAHIEAGGQLDELRV